MIKYDSLHSFFENGLTIIVTVKNKFHNRYFLDCRKRIFTGIMVEVELFSKESNACLVEKKKY